MKSKESAYATENGRKKLIEAAEQVKDKQLLKLPVLNQHENAFKYRYHVKSCYAVPVLVLKAKRNKDSVTDQFVEQGEAVTQNSEPDEGTPTRAKRRKRGECNTKCIICNCTGKYHQGDDVLYRIPVSSLNRARSFMNAYKLNYDEVFTRCSIYNTEGDIFAADIRYHKQCLGRYIKQYERRADLVLKAAEVQLHQESSADIYKEAFNSMLQQLNLDQNGYEVSHCCDLMNERLDEVSQINNRKVKTLLISHFKETICFTYPSCHSVHSGKKATPLHIAIAQAIHAVSKSKKLITIFNRFAISISYDEVLRIDTAVAKRTIALSTPGCIVPINPSIRPNIHINGAIDNFDLEENSKSGTNGSHDTVLILMQSIPKSVH